MESFANSSYNKNKKGTYYKDWHVHDFVSHDADGHVEDFVKSALTKRVRTLCFVNHPERMDTGKNSFSIDVKNVIKMLEIEKKEIEICREKYNGEIEIYQGIEIENRKSLKQSNDMLLKNYPFEIVVGSCHLIGAESVSSARNLSFFNGKKEEDVYNAFFDETINLIESYEFSFLAHFDIVKRYGVLYYGPFKAEKYKDRIIQIYNLMKEKGVGIEINTSGFFQGPQEPYPSESMVREALSCGVPFVATGSDAHSPDKIAQGFECLENIDRYNKGIKLLEQ